MIDTANTMSTRQSVQVINYVNTIHILPVYSRGYSLFKMNLNIGRFVGSASYRVSPSIGILWWFQPGIFKFSSLDATAPEVLVC